MICYNCIINNIEYVYLSLFDFIWLTITHSHVINKIKFKNFMYTQT